MHLDWGKHERTHTRRGHVVGNHHYCRADISPVVNLRTRMLTEQIKNTHLDAGSPYPSQQERARARWEKSSKDIKDWRDSLRLHLVSGERNE